MCEDSMKLVKFRLLLRLTYLAADLKDSLSTRYTVSTLTGFWEAWSSILAYFPRHKWADIIYRSIFICQSAGILKHIYGVGSVSSWLADPPKQGAITDRLAYKSVLTEVSCHWLSQCLKLVLDTMSIEQSTFQDCGNYLIFSQLIPTICFH